MEISLISSALLLGIATGLHCIGMCGPIALSMGMSRQQGMRFQVQNLTYNLGRVVTYAILGALVGVVGSAFSLAGFQRYLSIGAGVLLLLMAIFSFGPKNLSSRMAFLNGFFYQIKLHLSKLLQRQNLSGRFFTGILNGLLPCGMVYAALTAALGTGSIWQSSLYMALFGLGTIPFMFLVVWFGAMLSQDLRARLLRWVPLVMGILGVLFILRGLEVGIHFISPAEENLRIR